MANTTTVPTDLLRRAMNYLDSAGYDNTAAKLNHYLPEPTMADTGWDTTTHPGMRARYETGVGTSVPCTMRQLSNTRDEHVIIQYDDGNLATVRRGEVIPLPDKARMILATDLWADSASDAPAVKPDPNDAQPLDAWIVKRGGIATGVAVRNADNDDQPWTVQYRGNITASYANTDELDFITRIYPKEK